MESRMSLYLKNKINEMKIRLMSYHNDEDLIPTDFEDEIRELIPKTFSFIRSRAPDPIGRKIFMRIQKRADAPLNVGRARGIINDIEAYLLPRTTEFMEPRITEGSRYELRFERKMRAFENELARLRSNPALEKKVAQIEENLRKLRVASAASLEGNEKRQEDMLKRYKSAEKRVFVIMPFAPVFDDVWRGGIERACVTEGLGCLRVDEISLSTWITDDIKEYMEMASFVVVDITGNTPNVMFELGWALARDKKPIVIRQQDDPDNVPFDVQGIRYISYINSWSGIERLYRDICKFIKSTSETLNEKPTKKKHKKK